jgi:hypothetical protein
MPSRRTRNTAISVAIEGSYGSSPGTYSPILLTGTPDFTIDPDVVPRDLVRGFYGASEELIGTRRAVMKFTTELAGSSALGTAPEWGKLLRGCGWAEAITASTRVEYLPITQTQESLAFKFNRDGVQYLSRGARGTGVFNMTAYDRPTIDWEFWGFDTTASEVAVGTPALSSWVRPLVITDANSGNIKLGSTYATGTISSGTAYPSRGMTIDLGNKVEHMKMLLNEAIDITDRQMSGKATLELTTAEELTWRTDINANTLGSMSFMIGSGGNQVAFHMPQVQRTKPQVVDYQGKLLMDVDLRILPTASGNDECRIIVK